MGSGVSSFEAWFPTVLDVEVVLSNARDEHLSALAVRLADLVCPIGLGMFSSLIRLKFKLAAGPLKVDAQLAEMEGFRGAPFLDIRGS